MRIDSAPVSRQTGVTPAGGAPETRMKPGDIVTLEVLSKENGVFKLKNEDGSVIKAKLEDGVALSEGDTVKLLVTGKKDGVVYLSTDLDKLETSKPGGGAAVPGAADNLDSRITARLSQLNIPVREELVGRVRDLMYANPNMSVDEAVFLAANKVAADSPMVGPMLSLLSDGAKLDKMITSLLSLLQVPTDGTDAPQTQSGSPAAAVTQDAGAVQTQQLPQAGISDLVNAALVAETNTLTGAVDTGEPAVSAAVASVTDTGEAEEPDTAAAAKPGALPRADGDVSAVKAGNNTGGNVEKISSDTIIPQGNIEMHEKITENVGKTSIKMLTELFSGLPEFKGTPPEALERFSSALVSAASDRSEAAAKWPDDVSRLTEIIDKMFARPGAEGGGERLRQVKDELLVRLTMLEEEISRAQLPGRQAAAAETQKLIEHVRALQNVEQYVYMQIPVKLGEENKAAELYVFRQRKGSKRIDPDNVNILLSVDLTHLGHWESLVNIRGKDVSLRMEVKSAEAKEFFSDNTVKLHKLLDEAGFRLTEASISYTEEETNPLTALSSLLRFKTGNNPRIDLAV